MQKDVHFYLTHTLARLAGCDEDDALTIAWADQYTDDNTNPEPYGIQTQSGIFDNWKDTHIQASVLVPFHFIPGSGSWIAQPNSWRANSLVKRAVDRRNLLSLGIALHGLQDTFSHQGFSGWREDVNSCYPWGYYKSVLPNVGHAEMQYAPDVTNYVWTDPRTGKKVDNRLRVFLAAIATFLWLSKFTGQDESQAAKKWMKFADDLLGLLNIDHYDNRIWAFNDMIDSQIEYKDADAAMKRFQPQFAQAASAHLSYALELFADLSRA